MPGRLPYFTLSLPAWEVKIQIVKATPNIWDVLILQGTTYHTKVSVFPRQFIISSLKFSKRCLVSTSWLNIIKTSMLKRKVGLKFLQPCRMSFHDISLPIYLFWSHIRFYREILQTLLSQHLLTKCWQKFNVKKSEVSVFYIRVDVLSWYLIP